jgi:hypothetical protein
MAWVDSPVIYRPLSQKPLNFATIIVRVGIVDRIAVGGNIQRRIAGIDPDVPVGEIHTVNELASRILACHISVGCAQNLAIE